MAMAYGSDVGGRIVLERPIEGQAITRDEARTRRGRRLLWPLVALIAGVLLVVGMWTVTQPRADEPVETTPQVFSDDSAPHGFGPFRPE
jgi:hypothetical protein